jgi:membrane protease YdiL (CAAX protease family)
MTTTESLATTTDSPVAPRPPRIWKFWGTMIWSILLYGVMTASAVFGVVLAAWWYHLDFDGDPSALLNDGVIVAATSASAMLPVLLVVALAIRLARQKFRDYLALHSPAARHVVIGLGAIVVLMILIDATTALIGRPIVPDVMLDQLRTAKAHGAFGLFALALVVTAPITEEIVFRGFIFRGFSASRLGVAGAVVLSSLIFTVIHIQYDFVTLCGVMALALLLGTMRAVSGSTVVTISMHALNNFGVLLEALWFAGML